jgi:hypothetical protein
MKVNGVSRTFIIRVIHYRYNNSGGIEAVPAVLSWSMP